jgi:hypothetical protein
MRLRSASNGNSRTREPLAKLLVQAGFFAAVSETGGAGGHFWDDEVLTQTS